MLPKPQTRRTTVGLAAATACRGRYRKAAKTRWPAYRSGMTGRYWQTHLPLSLAVQLGFGKAGAFDGA